MLVFDLLGLASIINGDDILSHWRSHFTEGSSGFYRQQLDLWLGLIGAKKQASSVSAPEVDPRFSAPQWDTPLFDFIRRYYLLSEQSMTMAVNRLEVDDCTKERTAFFTKMFLEALSPAHFPLTNPEVIELAIKTSGKNLVNGMEKLRVDMQRGLMTTTDETYFEVGKNLAITPGKVVFENMLFQLIQYTPQTEKVYACPLLIVPPCINKYYIMDLQPENSMIRYIVSQGFSTFLISWKSITPEMGTLQWDDYIEQGILTAADIVRQIRKYEKVNVLAFCIGGQIATTAISVMQARGLDWFESITLMATMLDHADVGEIKHFINPYMVKVIEEGYPNEGVISGKSLSFVFSALRAKDLIWDPAVNHYLKGKTPLPFDVLHWNSDPVNLSLPMHSFLLRNMYLENNLTKPHSCSLCGVPIDLTQIKIPAYIFSAREDHIVPWQSAYQTTKLFRGPIRFVLGASGHIVGTINPIGANKRNYWVHEDLSLSAHDWLQSAQSYPGSWWQDWTKWLTLRSGRLLNPPKSHGNRRFKPIECAPGRYVKERTVEKPS